MTGGPQDHEGGGEARGSEGFVSVKGRFPFPVGASSCVFPADILPNVRRLCGCVDYVELALFESDAMAPLPDGSVIRELGAIARERSLSYTVHLPFDADVGLLDDAERAGSVRRQLRAMECVAGLEPLAFVMHWPAPADRADSAIRALWRDSLARSARELVESGVEPRLLCIETLDYPYEWVADIGAACGFSVCLDVGHVTLYGPPVPEFVEDYFDRVRVVHMHGVMNGMDHYSLSAVDPGLLSLLVSKLSVDPGMGRVMTIEVFAEDRLAESLRVISGMAG